MHWPESHSSRGRQCRLRGYASRAAAFPVIVEFRNLDEPALRIPYHEQHVAAMRILEPQSDWRGYSVVAADITNPAERDVELTLRIFGKTHHGEPADRLNLLLVIPLQTRTNVRVAVAAVESAPEGRRTNMARIADVLLFGREAQLQPGVYASRTWPE